MIHQPLQRARGQHLQRVRQCVAGGPRYPRQHPRAGEHHTIMLVAAEQFVSAIGRQCDFHAFARDARHEKCRHAGGVAEGFIEQIAPVRQDPDHFLGTENTLGVPRPEVVRDLAGPTRFVAARIGETDGEGMHRLTGMAREDRGDQR
ncbi:hypothetical protein D3C83_17250 [compost metagenome]